MKKLFLILLVPVLLLSFASCAAKEEKPAVTLPGQGSSPVRIEVVLDEEGFQQTVSITDAVALKECMRLYNRIEVGEMTDLDTTDSYNRVRLYMADGSSVDVAINGESLEATVDGQRHIFALNNFREFRNFVANSAPVSDTIDECIPEGEIAFLHYYAANAADVTVEDAETIEEIRELLSGVVKGNEVPEPGIDDGLIVFEFFYEDGSYYELGFLTGEYVYAGKSVYEVKNPAVVSAAMKAAVSAPQPMDADDIRYAYNDVINALTDDIRVNCEPYADTVIAQCQGGIGDYLGLGTDQLVMLYSPDNINLKAALYLFDGSEVRGEELDIAILAGAATCKACTGEYDGQAAIYVLYKNTANCDENGVDYFGTLYAFTEEGGSKPVLCRDYSFTLRFGENGPTEDFDSALRTALADERIVFGNLICDFPGFEEEHPITALLVS